MHYNIEHFICRISKKMNEGRKICHVWASSGMKKTIVAASLAELVEKGKNITFNIQNVIML